VIRSVCHKDPNHGGGNHYMMTGAPTPVPVGCGAFVTFHPSYGSVVSWTRGICDGLPAYVSTPEMTRSGGPNFLGARHAPFIIKGDPNSASFGTCVPASPPDGGAPDAGAPEDAAAPSGPTAPGPSDAAGVPDAGSGAAPSSDSSGGCGCHLAGPRARGTSGVLLPSAAILLALTALRRRRRRRRRRDRAFARRVPVFWNPREPVARQGAAGTCSHAPTA